MIEYENPTDSHHYLMHSPPYHHEKLRTNLINTFLFVVFIFILFIIMIPDSNNVICILCVHLSSIIFENFKDRALIIPEILEFIELHTYKFGLVFLRNKETQQSL